MNTVQMSITTSGRYVGEIVKHTHAVPGDAWSTRYAFRIREGQQHVFGGGDFDTYVECVAAMRACLSDLAKGRAA